MLDDRLNLEILENVVAGNGVSINISDLSKSLDKHRNTIKKQVQALLDHNIITGPYYPFMALFEQRPLFAVVRADLPKSVDVDRFLGEDESIFAAFRSWDEGYNTLLFEFHRDLTSYYNWKEGIVKDKTLPPLEGRFPADVVFLDNKLHVKYDPNSSVYCMEMAYRKNKELEINGYRMNDLGFAIMKKLLRGEGIKTNEHLLTKTLNTHRRTIERRIHKLMEAGVISKPLCRFPKYFVPPGYVLVLCFIRLNRCKEKIYDFIKHQCCIPIAYRGHTGRYNLLYMGTFASVEDHFAWEEVLHDRFEHDCFGAMKNTYLSPGVTVAINQQKVSLGVIRQRLAALKAAESKK